MVVRARRIELTKLATIKASTNKLKYLFEVYEKKKCQLVLAQPRSLVSSSQVQGEYVVRVVFV